MNKYFLLSLLIFSIIFFGIFLFYRISGKKDRTIFNTFPFENDDQKFNNFLLLILMCISTLCSVIFLIYFLKYESLNSWITCSVIIGSIFCVSFLVLCFLKFYYLKPYILVVTIFIISGFIFDITLGFGLWRLSKLNENILYNILSLITFVFSVLRILPLHEKNLMNLKDEKDKDGELKRPAFVKLAFYEWGYKILFFVEMVILLIITM